MVKVSRSRSILLQVAFKEAVGATLGTDQDIKGTTKAFYQTLIELHDELGIVINDDAPRGGGGFKGSRPKKQLPASVIEFTDSEGNRWVDWRPAKATGDAIAKHPDFKTQDNKRSVWMFAQDGTENEEAAELAKASDAMAALAG